jgi:hypothetical protein
MPTPSALAIALLHTYTDVSVSPANPPLATAVRFDGSFVVIAPNGMKFIFSPDDVNQVEKSLTPTPKPRSKSSSKPIKSASPPKK